MPFIQSFVQTRQWLQVCLWTFICETLFIHHLQCYSNA